MRNTIRLLALSGLALVGAPARAADVPAFVAWKDLKWVELAEPAGARQATLWGDSKAGDQALLVRWKFNTKAPDLVRPQQLHVVVLAGTFTAEIDGDSREFGPGGFVAIPAGVKHTLGCEAAGECRFVMHLSGAAASR